MKRTLQIVVLLLVIATVIFGTTSSFAESADGASKSAFNVDVFKNSPLYRYDKFDKSWSVQAKYKRTYSDAEIGIYLLLFDNYVKEEMGPEFRIRYFDKDEG